MSADPPISLEADMMVGDFRIEKRVGAGAMGVIYKARQVSLNRVVALKVLGSSLRSEAGIARFRREAQAVARLKHPGIADVYFIGQDEQICYIAMEYVEGASLREVILRLQAAPPDAPPANEVVWATGPEAAESAVMRFDAPTTGDPPQNGPEKPAEPLSPGARRLIARKEYVRWCVQIIHDAALAVAHAHGHGVIHRDLKPENLLLDPKGKVTVIDFGLARFFEDETITYTGQLVGTPLYMSPEQVLGQRQIDGRTDIYSLGMVLYELLALEAPLTAPNRESLFRQIATRWLPPIGWSNAAVPADLTAIVHRAISKDPDERYAGMADFAADLERFLAGKPVVAPPYRYRLDEREIVAQRPGGILYLVAITFAIIILLAANAGMGALAWLRGGDYSVVAMTQSVICAGAAAFLLFVGRALLLGQTWARWAGLALGIVLCVLGVLLFVYVLTASPLMAPLLPNAVLSASSGCAFLGVLSHPRVGRWFRFATETRLAFRRQMRRKQT
jgi:serine/threonine protein kinase